MLHTHKRMKHCVCSCRTHMSYAPAVISWQPADWIIILISHTPITAHSHNKAVHLNMSPSSLIPATPVLSHSPRLLAKFWNRGTEATGFYWLLTLLKPDDGSNIEEDWILETQDDEERTEERAEESWNIRCSSFLVNKSVPSIKNWPVTKILKVLYSCNISAPLWGQSWRAFSVFCCKTFRIRIKLQFLQSLLSTSLRNVHQRTALAPLLMITLMFMLMPLLLLTLQTYISHQDEDSVLAALINI